MDFELVKCFFFEGVIVVILNMFKGIEFGIDCNFWEVGFKFWGVKMIFLGIYFFYYSFVDKVNLKEVGFCMGFFFSLY